MKSARQQHEETAKKILARRGGTAYTPPIQNTSSQYDEMATKIVEKQKQEVNQDPEKIEDPQTEEVTTPEGGPICPTEDDFTINYDDLTKADIKDLLDQKGIPYKPKANKAELIELNEM